MKEKKRPKSEGPSVLDVVALLKDLPAEGLERGQVGTIVEQLDDRTSLVEFSDDEGRAYAVAPMSAGGAACPALRTGARLTGFEQQRGYGLSPRVVACSGVEWRARRDSNCSANTFTYR